MVLHPGQSRERSRTAVPGVRTRSQEAFKDWKQGHCDVCNAPHRIFEATCPSPGHDDELEVAVRVAASEAVISCALQTTDTES